VDIDGSLRQSVYGQCFRTNDIIEISKGIQAASKGGYKIREFLSWSLSRAARDARPDVVRYLLEHEGAPMDSLHLGKVGASQSAEVF
jgi:hypothetical protein